MFGNNKTKTHEWLKQKAMPEIVEITKDLAKSNAEQISLFEFKDDIDEINENILEYSKKGFYCFWYDAGHHDVEGIYTLAVIFNKKGFKTETKDDYVIIKWNE
jgi:hypothetical protein